MSTNSEKTLNVKLADCLRDKLPSWSVQAEQTNVLAEKKKQPDLVVSHMGGITVILETEFSPAPGVESDACQRLGKKIKRTGEEVEQCIAVKLPASLRKIEQENLDASVRNAHYFFAVFTYDGTDELYANISRWPKKGWVEGGLDDLATCIETAALSERRIAKGVQALELGVSQPAGYLQFHAPKYILEQLAQELHQEEGEQTTRMAMAILANAVIFHMRLARLHPKINYLNDHKTASGIISKSHVLGSWRAILNINYWPIFSLASDLFTILLERDAQKVISILDTMAAELERFGAVDIKICLDECFSNSSRIGSFWRRSTPCRLLQHFWLSWLFRVLKLIGVIQKRSPPLEWLTSPVERARYWEQRTKHLHLVIDEMVGMTVCCTLQ